jgi:hypothetical protein
MSPRNQDYVIIPDSLVWHRLGLGNSKLERTDARVGRYRE